MNVQRIDDKKKLIFFCETVIDVERTNKINYKSQFQYFYFAVFDNRPYKFYI